jgi:membrane protease YdiL (CAAX protease family)
MPKSSHVLGMVLLAAGSALAEEVLFRGFLCGQLARSGILSRWWSIIVSGGVFGVLHLGAVGSTGSIGAIVQGGLAVLSGVYLGWVFMIANNNIWPSVVIHCGLSLVGGVASAHGSPVTGAVVVILVMACGLRAFQMGRALDWRTVG